jgi:single-strand DNA-binding protein
MNKVILMGRLTRDIELKQTASGISYAKFSIAVDRRYSKNGQKETDFVNCTAWRQTAEFIGKYFHKGDMIAIIGSITTDNYTDKNGQKVYNTYVTVDETYFTGSRTGGTTKPNSADDFGFMDIDDEAVPF